MFVEERHILFASGHCDAFHAGWSHGQSPEIHRQSPHADRKAKKSV